MPQGRAQLFIPITKVDLEKREVWGVAAEERTDKTGREKFDYAESKPFFEAWIADFETRTSGKSKGNIREMHQPSAVGKAIAWDFDDAAKTIRVGAKVVDDAAWAKVTEGVLTGFSIGGSYARVWDDPDEQGVKRYAARPVETSLVDNPCMYGATFEVIRADGATELRKFTAKETSMAVDRAALLARWDACHKAAAALAGDRPLAKGLYTVSRLADMLASLRWMLSDEKAERDNDDEGSTIPEQLEAGIAALAEAFVALAEYHTQELRGVPEDGAAMPDGAALLAAVAGDLTKMEPLAAKAAMRRLQKMHDMLTELGAACAPAAAKTAQADTTAEEDDMKPEEIQKAVSDALGTSLQTTITKALEPVTSEVQKAVAAVAEQGKTLADLAKTVEAQGADIAALKAQPAAAPGITRTGGAREDDGAQKAVDEAALAKLSPHDRAVAKLAAKLAAPGRPITGARPQLGAL